MGQTTDVEEIRVVLAVRGLVVATMAETRQIVLPRGAVGRDVRPLALIIGIAVAAGNRERCGHTKHDISGCSRTKSGTANSTMNNQAAKHTTQCCKREKPSPMPRKQTTNAEAKSARMATPGCNDAVARHSHNESRLWGVDRTAAPRVFMADSGAPAGSSGPPLCILWGSVCVDC